MWVDHRSCLLMPNGSLPQSQSRRRGGAALLRVLNSTEKLLSSDLSQPPYTTPTSYLPTFPLSRKDMGGAISLAKESFPPKSNWGVDDIPDLTGKVIIVTGMLRYPN